MLSPGQSLAGGAAAAAATVVDMPLAVADLPALGRLHYQLEGVGDLFFRVPAERHGAVKDLLTSILQAATPNPSAAPSKESSTRESAPAPSRRKSTAKRDANLNASLKSDASDDKKLPPPAPAPAATTAPAPAPPKSTTPAPAAPSKHADDEPKHAKAVLYRCELMLLVTFLVTLYNSLAVPFQWAFETPPPLGITILEWIINAWLVLDIVLKIKYAPYRLQFYNPGAAVAMPVKKYLRGSRGFVLDLLIVIPLQALRHLPGDNHGAAVGLLLLNRCLGMAHLPTHLRRLMEHATHHGLPESGTHLLYCLMSLLFIVHWIDCILWVVARHSPEHSVEEWLDHEHLIVDEKPILTLYLIGFEFALELLHRTMHGVRPITDLQTAFTLFLSFIGVAVTATLIAAFEHTARSLDSAKEKYLKKIDGVTDVMKYMHLPAEFQDEVLDYYRHVFKTGIMQMGGQTDTILEELPESLRVRMNMALTADIVRHVPLFKNSVQDPQLMAALVGRLRPQVVLPSSDVVRKGDPGDSMFFISSGQLRVINQEGQTLKTFASGDFFGEVAILHDVVRTATIVADTYSNLFVLNKKDFEDLCQLFPAIRDEVAAAAAGRMAPPPPPPPAVTEPAEDATNEETSDTEEGPTRVVAEPSQPQPSHQLPEQAATPTTGPPENVETNSDPGQPLLPGRSPNSRIAAYAVAQEPENLNSLPGPSTTDANELMSPPVVGLRPTSAGFLHFRPGSG